MDERPSVRQNLMQIHWSTHTVIVKYDSHKAHKLSQWCLTADQLVPPEGNCSHMCSKVSSDWISSYIKTTWPILEIFKMTVRGVVNKFPDWIFHTRTEHSYHTSR